MQVEATKIVLKAPGNICLKLYYYVPLSTFAFKFSLRRYNEEADLYKRLPQRGGQDSGGGAGMVGWCRLTLSYLRRQQLELSD